MVCGRAPKRIVVGQAAPVDDTPSTGFMSIFSTTSANSLPSAPRVWMATASTPAIGPSPKAMTNSRAKTSTGMVRQNSQKRRTAMRKKRLGATLAAARKPSTKAPAAPSTVPT